MAKRAVFYARVSTDKDEQLNSIELQIEENEKAVLKNGWELVDRYIDRGKSGREVKFRDEYKRLMEDMVTDKFDIIVVKDQDRLQRNTKDWYIFIDRLVVNHLELFFYMENRFYTPDNALITGIKAIMAEDFSRNLSKKLKNFNDGRIEKAKNGDKNIVFHGVGKAYGWTQKNGVIALDPEQSKVRRLAIDLTLEGKGSTEVAKILNDSGYRNTVGKAWTVQDISRLVYDDMNAGTMILNKKRRDFEAKSYIYNDPSEWVYVEDAIPAIVTKEEMKRLKEICKERTTVDRSRGRKVGKSVFSGKLVCGCCGKPYWRKIKRNSDGEYWSCSTKMTKGHRTRMRDQIGGKKGEINEEGCDNTNISSDALNEIIEEATKVLSANTDIIKADRVKWLEDLKKKLLETNTGYSEDDLRREELRKDKLLEAYLDGVITKEDYQRKVRSIEDKIDTIKRDIKAAEGKLDEIADIDKVLENIDDEIAVYLTDDKKLKVDYILSEMSEVVIYPHEVRIKIPSFSKDLLVKRFQFVKEQNSITE